MRFMNDNRPPLTPEKKIILDALCRPSDMTSENWKDFAARLRRRQFQVVDNPRPLLNEKPSEKPKILLKVSF